MRDLVVAVAVLAVVAATSALGNNLLADNVTRPFSASDLHWVDNDGQFLQSSNGNFILGFNNVNSSARGKYYLCIALRAPNNPIVWTANRDVAVGREDSMVFQQDGNVVLFGSRGIPVWQTRTNGTDARLLQLQNNGNLVVLDSSSNIIWQSFDHPTDTLLAGQKLTPGMQLVSSKSTASSVFAPGPYSLAFGGGEQRTLELRVDLGGSEPVRYWNLSSDSRTILFSSKSPAAPAAYALLDQPGSLSTYRSDSTQVSRLFLPGQSDGTTSFLVLESDGNLMFRAFASGGPLSDSAILVDKCDLPLTCGSYGVCSSNGQCSCPDLLPQLSSMDATQGCKASQLDFCASSSPKDVHFQDLASGLSYFAIRFSQPITVSALDDCKRLCRDNCSCKSGFFDAAAKSCYLAETHNLGSLKNGVDKLQTFIKVSKASADGGHRVSVSLIIGCSVSLMLCSIAIFLWWYRRRVRAARGDADEEDGFLDSIPGLPTRFTYKQLQVATNGFSKRLGGGGFGSVYEGSLADKSKVAVKQLESIGQGKKEFRAEVATIGSIHHVNLVRLRGFCSEGNHRLLVYEFLARGSLDKSLFTSDSTTTTTTAPRAPPLLDWDQRYNVALGTARGLAYLHEDCRERIIHCDIKPENILLDDNFTAKVSDFGLAKLMNREQSHVFTTMRGTRGYLAPEWLMNTAISEKSDVYSFGMVVLELVSGRKNFDPNETSEKWYIPAYAFKQAEVGALNELLDSRLKGYADEEQVVKAVKIALWCIQEEMHLRPSTGKVVQMLEGNVPVPDPPLSSQLAVRLHARLVDAVSERHRYSISGSEFNSQDLLSASYLSGPR